jgi:LEA14-like dessication related protein
MKVLTAALALSVVFFSSCRSYKNVQEPEYRDIRDIRLLQPGPLQSTVGVDLIYYNPNNFGLQLDEARGDIYIDNAYFGRFNLNSPVQIRRRSEFTLPAELKVDMIGAVKNQRNLYKKKEAMVRIEGMARVRKGALTKEVPINYQRVENIERFRTLISG